MADMKLMKELMETIRQKENGPQPYDTTAEVTRVEGSTAWVRIPGSDGETPVQMSINARAGDTVRVRVAGGQAWTVGNDTAPPTDDRAAEAAQRTADEALLKVGALEAINIFADMIKTGKLSADFINGGTLKLGGENGKNGHLYLYNQNDELVALINQYHFVYFAEPGPTHVDTAEAVEISNADGVIARSGTDYGQLLEGEYWHLASRLRKALLEIYGWRGTRTDGSILPVLVYQENPLFSVEALTTKDGTNEGGDGVAIDFCEELKIYRNPSSTYSETPPHTKLVASFDEEEFRLSLDTSRTVPGSTDYALYEAILALGWQNDVID